jgi:hypothetical protein
VTTPGFGNVADTLQDLEGGSVNSSTSTLGGIINATA